MKFLNSLIASIYILMGRFKSRVYIKFTAVYYVPSYYILDKIMTVVNKLKIDYEDELNFRDIDATIFKMNEEYSSEFIELVTNRCDHILIANDVKYLSNEELVSNYLHLKLLEHAYITNFTARKSPRPTNPKPLTILEEYPQ